jgi:hypothetical protein
VIGKQEIGQVAELLVRAILVKTLVPEVANGEPRNGNGLLEPLHVEDLRDLLSRAAGLGERALSKVAAL